MMEDLIIKFLNGECSESEINQLNLWVKQSPENKEMFDRLKEINRMSIDALHYGKPERRGYRKEKTIIYSVLAAACLALIFTLSIIFPSKADVINTNEISFVFDGRQTELNTLKDQTLHTNGQSIGTVKEGILYLAGNSAKEISFLIPNGKKLSVVLSDGSVVKINSGTRISFPISFNNHQKRDVNLDGEAFFTVAKNPQKPFFVNTKHFVTRVLGTSFNVNSYGDENNSIALVEGSVEVEMLKNDKKVFLKPGEALQFDDKKTASVKKEIQKSVAWTNNELIFENNTLENIFKKIEKVYGVEILNENKTIAEEHFTGNFKDEKLENILEILKAASGCKYEIKGNKITIR